MKSLFSSIFHSSRPSPERELQKIVRSVAPKARVKPYQSDNKEKKTFPLEDFVSIYLYTPSPEKFLHDAEKILKLDEFKTIQNILIHQVAPGGALVGTLQCYWISKDHSLNACCSDYTSNHKLEAAYGSNPFFQSIDWAKKFNDPFKSSK